MISERLSCHLWPFAYFRFAPLLRAVGVRAI
jgi:hypothetical protein